MALKWYYPLRTNGNELNGVNNLTGTMTFEDCLIVDKTMISSIGNVGISGSAPRTIVFEYKGIISELVKDSTLLYWGNGSNMNCFGVFIKPYDLFFSAYGLEIFPALLYKGWIQVAITYADNIVTMYINGRIIGTKEVSCNTADSVLRIGKSTWNNIVSKFRIRELRIYDTELTQAEIDILRSDYTNISNYYTKTEIDTKLQNINVGSINLDTYVKVADLTSMLLGYTTDTELTEALSQYEKITDMLSLLNEYEKISDITTKLSQYITSSQLDEILLQYVLIENLKNDSVYINLEPLVSEIKKANGYRNLEFNRKIGIEK